MKQTKGKTKETASIKANRANILERQQLKDLQHLIDMDLNTYLVLRDEGAPQQIALTSQKAKSILLKHGPEMIQLALQIGENLPNSVENYINSVSAILHTAFGWIDDAVIHDYYISAQRLTQETHL